MLTDSNSPHSDLQSLLNWRELPATQEVLKTLDSLARPAERMANASPDRYRLTVNRVEMLPDGETITQMRNQFIGNFKGLDALKNLLDAREAELRETIKNQENTAK